MGSRTIQKPIYQRFCDRCKEVGQPDDGHLPEDWWTLTAYGPPDRNPQQFDLCGPCMALLGLVES